MLPCRFYMYGKCSIENCKFSHESWVRRLKLRKRKVCMVYKLLRSGLLLQIEYDTDGYSVFCRTTRERIPIQQMLYLFPPMYTINLQTDGFQCVLKRIQHRMRYLRSHAAVDIQCLPHEIVKLILDYDVPEFYHPYVITHVL